MLPLRIHQFSSSTSKRDERREAHIQQQNEKYIIWHRHAILFRTKWRKHKTCFEYGMKFFWNFSIIANGSSSSSECCGLWRAHPSEGWVKREKNTAEQQQRRRTTRWNTEGEGWRRTRKREYRLNYSRARLLILFAVWGFDEGGRRRTTLVLIFHANFRIFLSFFSAHPLFSR